MNKTHNNRANLPSSSGNFPYSLRLNQSQSGVVTKRNSSLRSKKNIRNVNANDIEFSDDEPEAMIAEKRIERKYKNYHQQKVILNI